MRQVFGGLALLLLLAIACGAVLALAYLLTILVGAQ